MGAVWSSLGQAAVGLLLAEQPRRALEAAQEEEQQPGAQLSGSGDSFVSASNLLLSELDDLPPPGERVAWHCAQLGDESAAAAAANEMRPIVVLAGARTSDAASISPRSGCSECCNLSEEMPMLQRHGSDAKPLYCKQRRENCRCFEHNTISAQQINTNGGGDSMRDQRRLIDGGGRADLERDQWRAADDARAIDHQRRQSNDLRPLETTITKCDSALGGGDALQAPEARGSRPEKPDGRVMRAAKATTATTKTRRQQMSNRPQEPLNHFEHCKQAMPTILQDNHKAPGPLSSAHTCRRPSGGGDAPQRQQTMTPLNAAANANAPPGPTSHVCNSHQNDQMDQRIQFPKQNQNNNFDNEFNSNKFASNHTKSFNSTPLNDCHSKSSNLLALESGGHSIEFQKLSLACEPHEQSFGPTTTMTIFNTANSHHHHPNNRLTSANEQAMPFKSDPTKPLNHLRMQNFSIHQNLKASMITANQEQQQTTTTRMLMSMMLNETAAAPNHRSNATAFTGSNKCGGRLTSHTNHHLEAPRITSATTATTAHHMERRNSSYQQTTSVNSSQCGYLQAASNRIKRKLSADFSLGHVQPRAQTMRSGNAIARSADQIIAPDQQQQPKTDGMTQRATKLIGQHDQLARTFQLAREHRSLSTCSTLTSSSTQSLEGSSSSSSSSSGFSSPVVLNHEDDDGENRSPTRPPSVRGKRLLRRQQLKQLASATGGHSSSSYSLSSSSSVDSTASSPAYHNHSQTREPSTIVPQPQPVISTPIHSHQASLVLPERPSGGERQQTLVEPLNVSRSQRQRQLKRSRRCTRQTALATPLSIEVNQSSDSTSPLNGSLANSLHLQTGPKSPLSSLSPVSTSSTTSSNEFEVAQLVDSGGGSKPPPPRPWLEPHGRLAKRASLAPASALPTRVSSQLHSSTCRHHSIGEVLPKNHQQAVSLMKLMEARGDLTAQATMRSESSEFLEHHQCHRPTANIDHDEFTALSYNVLSDRLVNTQRYPSSPQIALKWLYRRELILRQLGEYNADLIGLQELEMAEFNDYFQPKLSGADHHNNNNNNDYIGLFESKSRARFMSAESRKRVDGCAIFFKRSRFRLVGRHLLEFDRLAMANARGSEAMINRVSTRDNIAMVAVLELLEHDANTNGNIEGGDLLQDQGATKARRIIVCNTHIFWDPEFCDVKLVQTIMLMNELKNIASHYSVDLQEELPLVLLGDFNSLPKSGVTSYLLAGRITSHHEDFKSFRYTDCANTLTASASSKSESDVSQNDTVAVARHPALIKAADGQQILKLPTIHLGRKKVAATTSALTQPQPLPLSPAAATTIDYEHPFKLKSAYELGKMPFTNYTDEFKATIDYIFYSHSSLALLGLLGPIDKRWLRGNNIRGFPQLHFPSDHLPLLVKFRLLETSRSRSSSSNTSCCEASANLAANTFDKQLYDDESSHHQKSRPKLAATGTTNHNTKTPKRLAEVNMAGEQQVFSKHSPASTRQRQPHGGRASAATTTTIPLSDRQRGSSNGFNFNKKQQRQHQDQQQQASRSVTSSRIQAAANNGDSQTKQSCHKAASKKQQHQRSFWPTKSSGASWAQRESARERWS